MAPELLGKGCGAESGKELFRKEEDPMPASRDMSQRPVFVYSDLYSLFRKSRNQAQASEASASSVFVAKGEILKTHTTPLSSKTTQRFSQTSPTEDLKAGLKRLQLLQGKMRFLLHEIQDEIAPSPRPSFDSDED